MDDFDLRCINCGEFHEYGQWQCYNQGWENHPRTSWKVREDFNPWNPPIYQYYEEFDHQPFEQENGKINLEEIMGKLAQSQAYLSKSQANLSKHQEIFMNETRNSIKNIEISLQIISKHLSEESQSLSQNDTLSSPVEECEEFQIEKNGDSESIEENTFPQALEEEEEE